MARPLRPPPLSGHATKKEPFFTASLIIIKNHSSCYEIRLQITLKLKTRKAHFSDRIWCPEEWSNQTD